MGPGRDNPAISGIWNMQRIRQGFSHRKARERATNALAGCEATRSERPGSKGLEGSDKCEACCHPAHRDFVRWRQHYPPKTRSNYYSAAPHCLTNPEDTRRPAVRVWHPAHPFLSSRVEPQSAAMRTRKALIALCFACSALPLSVAAAPSPAPCKHGPNLKTVAI